MNGNVVTGNYIKLTIDVLANHGRVNRINKLESVAKKMGESLLHSGKSWIISPIDYRFLRFMWTSIIYFVRVEGLFAESENLFVFGENAEVFKRDGKKCTVESGLIEQYFLHLDLS